MRWKRKQKEYTAEIAAAWTRVVNGCGCPDIYYCPSSDDIECSQHSGFDVCCGRVDRHVPVPPDFRLEPASHAVEPAGSESDDYYVVSEDTLRQLQNGLGTLTLDGILQGYLASSVGEIVLPGKAPWPWFVVVWLDSTKERPFEDYGPGWWTVRELDAGILSHPPGPAESVRKRFLGLIPYTESYYGTAVTFDFAWLPHQEAAAKWEELGLRDDDF